MTKQRRWQLKQRALGRCTKCGRDAQGYELCREHAPYTRRVDVGLPRKVPGKSSRAQAEWRMAALHGVAMVAR